MTVTDLLLALILVALAALIAVVWRIGGQITALLDSLGEMDGDLLRAILNEIKKPRQ